MTAKKQTTKKVGIGLSSAMALMGKKVLVGVQTSPNNPTKMLMEARVLDYAFAFGKEQVLITPVNGSGQVWTRDFKLVE